MIHILENVSLAKYSTMRLGGVAAYLLEVTNRSEVQEALAWANARQLPIIMIGTGSNIIWRDEGFKGLVLVNKISGYQAFAEDEENYYITVGAGENWDSVVARSVEANASGIEALSLIPGTVGATPVQNVGAYGQEIAQTLVSIEAYDTQTQQFVTIPASDCGFGYRTSRFKTTDHGRFLIMGLTLHLLRVRPSPPFYSSLQRYLDEHNIHEFTPQVIRNAVVDIRRAKLPDPAVVANSGSFFANPMIDPGDFTQIQADYPDVVYWPTSFNRVKLSAAWLIEHAGFKDKHDAETGIGIWPVQSLILINEAAHSTKDLLRFKQKIIDAVQQQFGIILEQEPELLP